MHLYFKMQNAKLNPSPRDGLRSSATVTVQSPISQLAKTERFNVFLVFVLISLMPAVLEQFAG